MITEADMYLIIPAIFYKTLVIIMKNLSYQVKKTTGSHDETTTLAMKEVRKGGGHVPKKPFFTFGHPRRALKKGAF